MQDLPSLTGQEQAVCRLGAPCKREARASEPRRTRQLVIKQEARPPSGRQGINHKGKRCRMEPRQKEIPLLDRHRPASAWLNHLRGGIPQAEDLRPGSLKRLLRTSQENSQLQREDGQKSLKTQTRCCVRRAQLASTWRRRTHTHTNTLA